MDVKFKRAGEGQRLDIDSSSTSPKHGQSQDVRPARGSDLTHEQRKAADAAVARLNQPKTGRKMFQCKCRKYELTCVCVCRCVGVGVCVCV